MVSIIKSQQSKPIKKAVKHSKKFARTQTGCLQCRQKKKKCDGKRPSCQSCDKRGICCEFPANIRFFQFQYNDDKKSKPKSTITVPNTTTNTFTSEIKKEVKQEQVRLSKNLFQVDFKEVDLNEPPIKKEKIRTSEAKESSFALRRSASLSSSNSIDPQAIHVSRSSSLSSLAPSLISDYSDSDSYQDTAEDTEEALHLANDGESIGSILNSITIDLIKKSINNLQYIDFDTKLNNYYEQTSRSNSLSDDEIGKHIKEGLQFIENNSSVNFKPDEVFSFENAEML